LEGIFIVFRIENSHNTKTLDEKLNILEGAEGKNDYFGKAVFRSSGFADWEVYYDIYKELSSYIHFSYTRSAHIIQGIKRKDFPRPSIINMISLDLLTRAESGVKWRYYR